MFSCSTETIFRQSRLHVNYDLKVHKEEEKQSYNFGVFKQVNHNKSAQTTKVRTQQREMRMRSTIKQQE